MPNIPSNNLDSKNIEPLQLTTSERIEFIKFRFVDILAQEHCITCKLSDIHNQGFQGVVPLINTNIVGIGSNNTQVYLAPDPSPVFIDPFTTDKTLVANCTLVVKSNTTTPYAPISIDPRNIAAKADDWLKTSGVGRSIVFFATVEFFIFNDIEYYSSTCKSTVRIKYLPPQDKFASNSAPYNDLCSEVLKVLESIGIDASVHLAQDSNKYSLSFTSSGILQTADAIQYIKYVVKHVARSYGKIATFMPNPFLKRNRTNAENMSMLGISHAIYIGEGHVFKDTAQTGLSDQALFYACGILKRINCIQAFANPNTNSYRSNIAKNIAISWSNTSNYSLISSYNKPQYDSLCINISCPDSSAHPYFTLSALVLAGIDGIKTKLLLDDLVAENNTLTRNNIDRHCATSLSSALNALDNSRHFLKADGVFDDIVIDYFIDSKRHEIDVVAQIAHQAEFKAYY